VYLSPGSSNCSLKVAIAVPVGAINGCGWASTRVSRVCSYRSLPPLFIRSTPPPPPFDLGGEPAMDRDSVGKLNSMLVSIKKTK